MNRQTIEKAARDYVKPTASIIPVAESIAAKEGFIAGANWRINSVWHDASEKPNKNQLVLFECRKTYGKGYSVNFGENYELMKNVILRWVYIIDLLPDGKEPQK